MKNHISLLILICCLIFFLQACVISEGDIKIIRAQDQLQSIDHTHLLDHQLPKDLMLGDMVKDSQTEDMTIFHDIRLRLDFSMTMDMQINEDRYLPGDLGGESVGFPIGNMSNLEGEWVLINGGAFNMGSQDLPLIHSVNVRDFYITKTEVTVKQYRKCVDAGVCIRPNHGCHWSDLVDSHENHPINCIDWEQARAFAKWVGGDLPSEAQWEYAARSGGRDIKYPWGNEEASCTYAVMYDNGVYGCGLESTWEVCSKTEGHSAQALCDMAGNVSEWVLDEWHDSYTGAPINDQGWCSDRECSSNTSIGRVFKGGSWSDHPSLLYATGRRNNFPSFKNENLGFRVSKTID